MSDVSPNEQELRDRVAALEERIHEYHRTDISRWAESVSEAQRLFEELDRMRETVSWRVTAPLRTVRRRQLER